MYILVNLCSCLYRTLYSYLHKHHLKRMLQLDMWSLCPSSGPTIILQLKASKMQADLDLDPHTIRVPERHRSVSYTSIYPYLSTYHLYAIPMGLLPNILYPKSLVSILLVVLHLIDSSLATCIYLECACQNRILKYVRLSMSIT